MAGSTGITDYFTRVEARNEKETRQSTLDKFCQPGVRPAFTPGPSKRPAVEKRPVSRPRKKPRPSEQEPVTLSDHQAAVEAYKRYEEALVNIYTLKLEAINIKRHRSRYSARDMATVQHFLRQPGVSVRQASLKLSIPKSTIHDMKKKHISESPSTCRGVNKVGAGRPVSYSTDLDEAIIAWVIKM